MALSDLAVYSDYAYSAFTETLQQQIDLFNSATAGCLQLGSAANRGDYTNEAFFAKVSGGLVRRRNAYGTGNIAEKKLAHAEEVSVKVAAGTPAVRLDPSQFKWILQNPEVAGAAMGQQLAVDSLADMVNIALGAAYVALLQVTAVVHDITGETGAAAKMNFSAMNVAQSKFGDRSDRIACYVMHSKPMHDLYAANLTNTERLFTYSNINVIRDPFGKLLVMTDSANLVTSAVYHTLGLVPGAVSVMQNPDFTANEETSNGEENIKRTYQAEWSYNLSVKGFAWDKANGGKSPSDAAILTSTNWDKIMTDNKDLAGVVIESD